MSPRSDRESTRRSGVLLPVSSLPGSAGVGGFGPAVERWLDWLSDAGQAIWQVLPLGTTTSFSGHSPYSSLSAFAIDPIYISLDRLVEAGWLEGAVPSVDPPGVSEYVAERERREQPLRDAFAAWRSAGGPQSEAYAEFLLSEASWVADYALFMALRRRYRSAPWFDWPSEIRDRDAVAIEAVRSEESDEVDFELFLQFEADREWRAIRQTAAERGVDLFGDLPIYVSWDSADVWVERPLFELDETSHPTVVSGVPPDYFSETGQRWGNPIYRWQAMEEGGYRWWIERLRRNGRLFDLVRIDHFRAFESYWEIPAGEPDAVNGEWVKGPGRAFFDRVREELPDLELVAEDLGIITDEVRALRDEVGLPGMRVLQFAFGEDFPHGEHVLHALERHQLLYTGTHDNNTVVGWFEDELGTEDRGRLRRYLGRRVSAKSAPVEICRLALSSVAATVILPLQDVLGLGAKGRLNKPGIAGGNWRWRALETDLDAERASALRDWTETYGRLAPADEEAEGNAPDSPADTESESAGGEAAELDRPGSEPPGAEASSGESSAKDPESEPSVPAATS